MRSGVSIGANANPPAVFRSAPKPGAGWTEARTSPCGAPWRSSEGCIRAVGVCCTAGRVDAPQGTGDSTLTAGRPLEGDHGISDTGRCLGGLRGGRACPPSSCVPFCSSVATHESAGRELSIDERALAGWARAPSRALLDAGPCVLGALKFSNCARSEETGFCRSSIAAS